MDVVLEIFTGGNYEAARNLADGVQNPWECKRTGCSIEGLRPYIAVGEIIATFTLGGAANAI